MKNNYTCPHCQTVLNPSVKILLVVQYNKKRGMILLSPQPGNFKFICEKGLRESLVPGSLVNFFCPVCSVELISDHDNKFAELNIQSPGKSSKRIEFSREFGKEATFIIDGENIFPFGSNVDEAKFKNFFGS